MQSTNIDWVRNPDGSKGNSWNPLTGCLGPADGPCPYCYARKIATRFAGSKSFPNGFEPTWHPERLDEPLKLKKPSRIFAGSMSDFFGSWITHEQIDAILEVIAACPQHTFYMLTKQPQNIMERLYKVTEGWPIRELGGGDYLPNLWLGVSIDTQKRANETLRDIFDVVHSGWSTLVSVEPILTAIEPYSLMWADWVIVGAQSGRDAAKHKPKREWIESIVGNCVRLDVPVFLKDSITNLWPDLQRREWPDD